MTEPPPNAQSPHSHPAPTRRGAHDRLMQLAEVRDNGFRPERTLRLWVELVREARADGLDLDHAVTRVRERTAQRYAVRSVPEVEHKLEVLSSTEADVAGIWRWLDAQASLESAPG